MSKLNRRLVLAFTSLGLGVMPFQNCGKEGAFRPAQNTSVELYSTESIDQPIDDDHPLPEVTVQETAYETLLADRYYINSLFKDVFGPSATAVDSVQVSNDPLNHGSPCSVYEDYNTLNTSNNTYVRANAMQVCSTTSPNLNIAPLNPQATVTRSALLTHACSDLTTNNVTLRFALNQVSTAFPPAANEANVRKVFDLFYRVHPEPHQGLIDSLLVMLPESGATAEDWRLVVYTVCASGLWQVL